MSTSVARFRGLCRHCKCLPIPALRGSGAPAREAVFSEEEKKQMMLHAYRKQEQFKKLETDSEDAYLNSDWSDSSSLKRQMQGLKDIKLGPR